MLMVQANINMEGGSSSSSNNVSPSTRCAAHRISTFANNTRALTRTDDTTALAPGYTPGRLDVICARGKQALNHSGNRRLKVIIEMYMPTYSKAKTKIEKSLIVSEIVDSIREASPNGGFIKEFGGVWFEVGDQAARDKIGQCFRDMLHDQYKSSNKAKKRRQLEKRSSSTVDSDESEEDGGNKPSPQVQPMEGSSNDHFDAPEPVMSSSPYAAAASASASASSTYPANRAAAAAGSHHDDEMMAYNAYHNSEAAAAAAATAAMPPPESPTVHSWGRPIFDPAHNMDVLERRTSMTPFLAATAVQQQHPQPSFDLLSTSLFNVSADLPRTFHEVRNFLDNDDSDDDEDDNDTDHDDDDDDDDSMAVEHVTSSSNHCL